MSATPPSPGALSSLITAVATASSGGCCRPRSNAVTGASVPGRTRSRAAATYRQNRAGSLSAVSSDSHAAGGRLRRAQSPSTVVLPKPAGVLTTVSPEPVPCERRASSRGRGTKPARGTWNLVATSTSRPGAGTPGGQVVGDLAISPYTSAASPASRVQQAPLIVVRGRACRQRGRIRGGAG